jgi:hypothetical protein
MEVDVVNLGVEHRSFEEGLDIVAKEAPEDYGRLGTLEFVEVSHYVK